MQLIPSEIWFHIFSYIPCHDLPRLRLVNKWFDEQVSQQLNTFSLVRLISHQSEWEELDASKYRLEFKEFKMYVEDSTDLFHHLSFVKSKFAGLQAIDLYDTLEAVTLSSLIPFACHLKYIRAYQIIVDVSHNSVQDIMDMFPALQAFDVGVASELFCTRMWARRSNFVQWSNKCDHSMPCENTFDLPTTATKCMKLFEFSPRQLSRIKISSSLEALTLIEPDAALPILHLPKLRFFKLESSRNDLESHTFFNYLGNAPNVCSIYIYVLSMKNSTSLSCLSLVNSLPKLERLHMRTQGIIEPDDLVEPMTFRGCKKRRLNQVSLSIGECSSNHLAIIKSLLDSSGISLDLTLDTSLGNITLDYQPERTEMLKRKFEDGSVFIKCNNSSMVKQFLAILAPRNNSAVTRLDFSVSMDVDACFVEDILRFKNLQKLTGKFTEEFIRRWMPLFTLSDNKKNLRLEFSKSHEPTRETHDLLVKAMNDGSLVKISGKWVCPIESAKISCTCGLKEHHSLFMLSDFFPLFA